MINSILDSVKKTLDIDPSLTAFDENVITHINTAFDTLNDLGIGPAGGYMIMDNTATWDAFIGNDPRLNRVKTYIYLYVRRYFDPPQTSFAIAAMDHQIQELEVRLNTLREATAWVDPQTLTTDPATGLPLPPPNVPPSDDSWWVEF